MKNKVLYGFTLSGMALVYAVIFVGARSLGLQYFLSVEGARLGIVFVVLAMEWTTLCMWVLGDGVHRLIRSLLVAGCVILAGIIGLSIVAEFDLASLFSVGWAMYVLLVSGVLIGILVLGAEIKFYRKNI
jgi:hypothetical protein